jgi:hypothetical protein
MRFRWFTLPLLTFTAYLALLATALWWGAAHPPKAAAVEPPPPDRALTKSIPKVESISMERLTTERAEDAALVASRGAERAVAAIPTPTPTPTPQPATAAPAPSVNAQPSGTPTGNRGIGQRMMLDRWGLDQWPCLNSLWSHESGWRTNAANPSGAYGIPQALPGSKMAAAGGDWQTNPVTQIRWGLGYIAARYGSPCGAWGHFQAVNWY